MVGRVFSIEEFSTFDGPGIRTTVFLKGCPLSCIWCHNPEGQSRAIEYMRSPNGCTGCGACMRMGELESGSPSLCEASIAACPNHLVRRTGTDYTPEELAKKLNKNARILKASGGGITFSGGEPLMHADFILATAPLLDREMSVALQTSGYASEEVFRRVLDVCDFVLYDLKLASPALHRTYCGVDNAPILNNYRILASSGKRFITRIPLIPGITDTDENLHALARFISSHGVKDVEVLPYNKLTGSKYSSLLRTYSPSFDEQKECNLGIDIFKRYGITAKKM